MRLRDWPQRISLFARDYFSEFSIAWSLARMSDCERYGGHQWTPWHAGTFFDDGKTPAQVRDCERCGSSEWRDEDRDLSRSFGGPPLAKARRDRLETAACLSLQVSYSRFDADEARRLITIALIRKIGWDRTATFERTDGRIEASS